MAKMTVDKSDAADLLKAVGLVIADKWEADKLASKLAAFDKIQGVQEKVAEIEDEDLKKLGSKTLAACAKGVTIIVTEAPPEADASEDSDVSDEPEVKAKPAKKPTKPAGKPEKPVKPVKPEAKGKPEKKAPKEKKEKANIDPWGTREGTRTARINAVLLTGKAFETSEIEEKADARGIHSHLTKLKSAGWIERTPDGKYQATKKGLALKPEKKAKK